MPPALHNLAGHRAIGGMRASLYNAMPIDGVARSSTSCANSNGGTADAVPGQDAQQHLAEEAWSACRPTAMSWAPRSGARTRSSCVRRTCTRIDIPGERDRGRAGGRRHQQHPGFTAVAARRAGIHAPGANANAVKELVLAGLFLGARHIGPALDFVRCARPCAATTGRGRRGRARSASSGTSCRAARSAWWASARSASRSRMRHTCSACTSWAMTPRSRCSAPGSCRPASSRR